MNARTLILILTLAAGAFALSANLPDNLDDRIESSAKKSYVFQTYLKDDKVEVDSQNGNVTLTGSVVEESHKSLAQETVAGLPGVKKVTNNLEITGERPPERTDGWIKAKIKTALVFHRHVSGGTEVDVKNGVVTLKGTARNQAEKNLATEYARDIDGVRTVNNEMVIAPKEETGTNADKSEFGQKVDDASITSQIKLSLLTHKSTSALKTRVRTENGKVTLTGKANQESEKEMAAKLAKDIEGVRSVQNNIVVEDPQTD